MEEREPTAIIPYLRHHSHCEWRQQIAPHCTCGLAEAIEQAFPDMMAEMRTDWVKSVTHTSMQCGSRCEVHRDG